MPAVIESTLYVSPGGAVVPGSTQQNSRDDLQMGYQVVLHSVQAATTYSWDLSFASDSPGSTVPGTPFDGTQSASALLPPLGSTSRDAKFNVDFEGTYLIRLTTDAGLPSEDTQFIRCRVLTLFGALKLVAAGERRDENGVVPVDATPEGWANDQNANMQRISLLLRRLSTSGRTLYVDANRGRDNSADQDDYDNVISIPGPDTARTEETGIKLRAMAHGDFSSINEAIAYAVAAATRSEPAPSRTNPYFIHIRPGFYEEDLNLAPFVHLIGDLDAYDGGLGAGLGGQQTKPVIIRTVNAGGTGTHTFNPQATWAVAECFLTNLHLENTANTTSAVLDQQGGLLALTRCVVKQQGDDAAQGAALRCETADPAHTPVLYLMDSQVISEATTADRSALYFDASEGILVLATTTVLAESCNALTVNPSLYEVATVIAWKHSYLSGLVPFAGYPSHLRIVQSGINGIDPIGLLISPPGGVGAKPGNVVVELVDLTLVGQIQFNTTNAVGTTHIEQSNVTNTGASPGLALPDAPGDVPVIKQYTRADTLWYVKGYIDPREGPPGVSVIPGANQVNVEDVQRVIDILWQGAFPVTGSPFFSLTGSYNGASSLDPYTPGVGLGRNINAVGGAVQIQGASWPTGLESYLKHGGLQVGGILDIGVFIGGAGSDTVAKVGGSDIHLNPNQAGAGPFLGLGRTWNGVFTTPASPRGFPGTFIVAGGAQPAASEGAFHLHLRTTNLRNPNVDRVGNIYMVAGTINDGTSPDVPGDVHIVGGSHTDPARDKGALWLVPGNAGGTSAGVIWLVGTPTGGTRATLAPVNNYVPGAAVAGTIYFSTPGGIDAITFVGGETLVQARAAFTAQAHHVQVVVAAKLTLTSEFGPSGDILYLGDTVGGALNTALGNYSVPGATFTPGTYGHKVSVDVPQNGRLRVNGDLEVTGAIIGGGGGGVYQDTAAALYNVALGSNIDILGVNLVAGTDTAVVLNAAEPVDRRITIKDEDGLANAIPSPAGQMITISDSGGALFDGATPLNITTAHGSVSLYKNAGGNWSIW